MGNTRQEVMKVLKVDDELTVGKKFLFCAIILSQDGADQ